MIDGPTSDDAFRRATRELKHFSVADSDRLVTVFDAGRHGGAFYYAMEYLPLGSLEKPGRDAGAGARRTRGRATLPSPRTPCTSAASPTATSSPPTSCSPTTAAGSSDLGLSQLLSPGMVVTGLGQIGLEFTDPAIMLGAEPPRGRATSGRSVRASTSR